MSVYSVLKRVGLFLLVGSPSLILLSDALSNGASTPEYVVVGLQIVLIAAAVYTRPSRSGGWSQRPEPPRPTRKPAAAARDEMEDHEEVHGLSSKMADPHSVGSGGGQGRGSSPSRSPGSAGLPRARTVAAPRRPKTGQ